MLRFKRSCIQMAGTHLCFALRDINCSGVTWGLLRDAKASQAGIGADMTKGSRIVEYPTQ